MGILNEGDIIHEIPNADEYDRVIRTLSGMGYKIFEYTNKNSYHAYPNLSYIQGKISGNCTEPGNNLHRRRITLSEFYIMIGEIGGESDWREKLSQSFNEKLNNAKSNQKGTPSG